MKENPGLLCQCHKVLLLEPPENPENLEHTCSRSFANPTAVSTAISKWKCAHRPAILHDQAPASQNNGKATGIDGLLRKGMHRL